jgi:hypothetical protein
MIIVDYTNSKEKDSDFIPLTLNELYVYIGQKLFMGLYHLPGLRDYWREDKPILAPGIFNKGLSRNRWLDINSTLHVEPERIATIIAENFRKHRYPGPSLTVDETRIPFDGRYEGIIWTPNKPARYALEHYSIRDNNGYMYYFIPRLAGEKITAANAVLRMASVLPDVGKNGPSHLIVAASRFGTISTAMKLKEMNLFFIFAASKVHPVYIFKRGLHKKLRKGETVAAQKGDLLAISTFSRKRVNLFTNYYTVGDSKNYKCGRVLEDYDINKHSVDDFNRLLALYAYGHRHMKWTSAFFDGLVKMVITNAFFIYKEIVSSKVSYREFLECLIEELVMRKEAKK